MNKPDIEVLLGAWFLFRLESHHPWASQQGCTCNTSSAPSRWTWTKHYMWSATYAYHSTWKRPYWWQRTGSYRYVMMSALKMKRNESSAEVAVWCSYMVETESPQQAFYKRMRPLDLCGQKTLLCPRLLHHVMVGKCVKRTTYSQIVCKVQWVKIGKIEWTKGVDVEHLNEQRYIYTNDLSLISNRQNGDSIILLTRSGEM